MNRARRRLTSVIEQISMSERRIPYMKKLLYMKNFSSYRAHKVKFLT